MINDFIKYVKEKHDYDLTEIFEQYKLQNVKETRTIKQFIEYVCFLFIQKYDDIMLIRPPHKRGTNDISIVQGIIVKAVLEVGLPGINPGNVYKKIFGAQIKDRTMVYYWKDRIQFIGKELVLYNKAVDFLHKHNIVWEETPQEISQ